MKSTKEIHQFCLKISPKVTQRFAGEFNRANSLKNRIDSLETGNEIREAFIRRREHILREIIYPLLDLCQKADGYER